MIISHYNSCQKLTPRIVDESSDSRVSLCGWCYRGARRRCIISSSIVSRFRYAARHIRTDNGCRNDSRDQTRRKVIFFFPPLFFFPPQHSSYVSHSRRFSARARRQFNREAGSVRRDTKEKSLSSFFSFLSFARRQENALSGRVNARSRHLRRHAKKRARECNATSLVSP